MASTKVTFVTGTAEVKRRDPLPPKPPPRFREHHLQQLQQPQPHPHPDQQQQYQQHLQQRLTTEPNVPQQVTFVDGKCTCCPYGYHIDLDFLNFCRDMESGSTLQNLKRIQKAKRKLRKSMEIMLDEQGGMMTSEGHSAPPDVVHSTEAGRLMHMINYERSATHRILNQIDSSVNTTIGNIEGGRGRRYLSSDSDEPNTPYTPYGPPHHRTFDESGVTPSSFASGRTDSLSSLSSVSTMSSESPMMYQAQVYHQQQMQHHQHTKSHRTTTKVIENPVIEMATAEMKQYSSHSSAQLMDNGLDETDFSPKITPDRTPPMQSPSPRESPDVNQMSLQSVREAMGVSLQRLKELEEQVKAIPILQVRISVMKEEKRLLNLQLKASKTNNSMNMRSVGVGSGTVTSPTVKTPPPTFPKPVRTTSVGVGDHSVVEPYLAQPNLPTGYTIRENETHTEIHTTSVIEKESVFHSKMSAPSLSMSFKSPSYEDKVSRSASSFSEGHPRFTINQIQRAAPRALTRTIGTGDGNVFESSGLHVHEKEMRTVIIGSGANVAKRNVGIECKVPTRDVGVSFMCDEEKPQTRTIGVNVNYDTSGIHTSLDFKGETELRMALRGVLQRNVHSVGTNCNFRTPTSDASVATDHTGISVGCGDESHRIDVEVRPMVATRSASVSVKPETVTKCISTDKGWAIDASTNTVTRDKYSKAVMTDRPRQLFASTNTDAVISRHSSNQTEVKTFLSMDQLKHASSNTQKPSTYSTGICTDIVTQYNVGVNTIERGAPPPPVVVEKKAKTIDRGVGDGRVDIEEEFSSSRSVSVEEQILKRGASQANAFLTGSKSMSTESEAASSCRMETDDSSQFSSYEITRRSSAPVMQEFNGESSYESQSKSRSRAAWNRDAEIGSPLKEEDSFQETITEHYVITSEGKKLISEEKMKSVTSGGKTTNSKSLTYGPAADRLSSNESASHSESTSSLGASSSFSSNRTERTGHSSNSYGDSMNSKSLTYGPAADSLSSNESASHSESTSSLGASSSFSSNRTERTGHSSNSYGDSMNSKSLTYGPAADSLSSNESASHSESTSSLGASSSFSSNRTERTGHSSNSYGDSMKTSSVDSSEASSDIQSKGSQSTSSTTIVTNPYRTIGNLAEVSSMLDSESSQSSRSGFRESKTRSESNLSKDVSSYSGGRSSSSAKSMDIIYDMRRAGSVEDFMPDDIRRYMSIDPSTSKDSGFGEELHSKFSEESSSGGGAKCMKMNKTVTKRRTLKTGDKVSVQETKTFEGPNGKTVTTYTEQSGGDDDENELKSAGLDASSRSTNVNLGSLSEREKSALSEAMQSSTTSSYSSSIASGYVGGGSDTNLASKAYGQHSLSDFSSHSRSSSGGVMSVSETTVSTVGEDEMRVSRAEMRNYGSLDRKTGKLKSIMKHAKSDSERLSGKKGITFAESVMGGTGSSSDGNTSDSDSTSSYEEGSYDSRQGEVSFQCQDDEAIAQGLPGAQMFDQNIRETYELSNEMRQACDVLATYLTDSTTITTKQLNASTNVVQQEWFRVSSHKLSCPHQVEDYLSSVNEISKRLLEYIVNMTDANGNTAIHYCISHCNFEIANLLLDSEVCDINKQNKPGYTPIMLAGLASVQNGEQRDIIRRLFARGDINARATTTEQTALMLAASHGRTEMVRLLVEEGADYNLQDVDGSTALMCACEHGHLDIVTFLLSQPNIDAEATDNEDSTALNIAMEADHKDIGVVLYKHLNFSKVSSPHMRISSKTRRPFESTL